MPYFNVIRRKLACFTFVSADTFPILVVSIHNQRAKLSHRIKLEKNETHNYESKWSGERKNVWKECNSTRNILHADKHRN